MAYDFKSLGIVFKDSEAAVMYSAVRVTVKNIPNVPSQYPVVVPRTVKWSYYREGYPKEETVFSSTPLSTTTRIVSATETITGLMPSTRYRIIARLYRNDNLDEAYAEGSITVTTMSVGALLEVTDKSSTALVACLSRLPVFSYNTRIEFSIKRKTDAVYHVIETVTVTKNTTRKIKCAFSNLKVHTTYDIKAEIYKAEGKETFIKAFTTKDTTLYYTPDEKPTPYIRSAVAVPGSDYGYLTYGVMSDKPSELLNFKYHLYVGNTESILQDAGEIGTDVVGTWGKCQIEKPSGTGAFYQIVVKDGNGTVVSRSPAVEVDFTTIDWTQKSSGDPFVVTASQMRQMADSMLKAYEYLSTLSSVSEDITEAYSKLKRKMDDIEQNAGIAGGSKAVLSLVGTLANAMRNEESFVIGVQYAAIYPARFNELAYAVEQVLLGLGEMI